MDHLEIASALIAQSESGPKRAPNSLISAWKATEPIESTERVFRNAGFVPWAVYCSATLSTSSSKKFTGKASLSRVIDFLQRQDADFKQRTAQQIDRQVSNEHAQLIRGWLKRAETRHRMAAGPTSTNEPEMRANDNLFVGIGGHTTLQYASLSNARALFPKDWTEGVVCGPHPENEQMAASITMTYPKDQATQHFGYQMSVTVAAHIASRLLEKIFEYEIQIRNNIRQLVHEGTAFTPTPRMTISGCRPEVLYSAFGPEMTEAIIENPFYQSERSSCLAKTQSVQIIVSSNPAEDITLLLSLGVESGSKLVRKLYQNIHV